MSGEEKSAEYLESGTGRGGARLDLIRSVLRRADTWAPPPPEILDGVLAEVGSGLEAETTDPSRPRWPVLAAVIGVAAAVVLLVASTLAVLDDRTETVIALSGTDLEPGAGAEAVLRPTASGWWIRLDVAALPPAPEGSYYEGWVWDEEGTGVAVGTFHLRGGDDPVILWSGVDLEDYRTISVTLEPEDGDPEPSGRVVLRGVWEPD